MKLFKTIVRWIARVGIMGGTIYGMILSLPILTGAKNDEIYGVGAICAILGVIAWGVVTIFLCVLIVESLVRLFKFIFSND